MDKKWKMNALLIAFGVILYAIVMNFSNVLTFGENIIGIFSPVLIGLILAFVLSVPMNGIKRRLFKLCEKCKLSPKDRTIDMISLVLTFCFLILIIVFICVKIVPQIVASVKSIVTMIQVKWPQWAAILKSYNIDTTPVTDWLENLKFESILTKFMSGAGLIIDKVAGTAASTISVVTTVAISLVVMFYILISRKDLERQCTKALYAYLKKEVADRIIYIACLIRSTYTKFLSGQFVEAFILGFLMFIAFLIFRIPYAGLVATLTGICSFIPYVGAFFSCGVGVFLTLILDPKKAIMCLIVYQVVQFVENQFIYPHVVGNSVGLSPLWTLVAVLIGGKLFGLVGMIFFIPMVAVIYTLLRDDVYGRLRNKKVDMK